MHKIRETSAFTDTPTVPLNKTPRRHVFAKSLILVCCPVGDMLSALTLTLQGIKVQGRGVVLLLHEFNLHRSAVCQCDPQFWARRLFTVVAKLARSEYRRVGKECVSTCRS